MPNIYINEEERKGLIDGASALSNVVEAEDAPDWVYEALEQLNSIQDKVRRARQRELLRRQKEAS